MEALRLLAARPRTTATRTGDNYRADGWNLARKACKSLQLATLRSGGQTIFTEKGKNYGVFGVLGSGELIGSFQQIRHLQSRKAWCASSDERQSSASTVVSDDDVEIHRQELLALYWDDGYEGKINRKTDGEAEGEEEEEDEKTEVEPDDGFIARRAAARASLYSAFGREEDYLPEKTTYWWMRLAVHVRRMLTPRTKGILLLNILTFLYGKAPVTPALLPAFVY